MKSCQLSSNYVNLLLPNFTFEADFSYFFLHFSPTLQSEYLIKLYQHIKNGDVSNLYLKKILKNKKMVDKENKIFDDDM